MLVSGVVWWGLSEYLLHYSITRSHGVDELLAIRLVVDLERGPASRELDLPSQLSIPRKNIDLSRVTATFQHLSSQLHAITRITDHVFVPDVFEGFSGVDSAAVLAHWKVWKNLRVLLLPHRLLDNFSDSLRAGEDQVDLAVEESILIGLGSGDHSVLDPCLVQRIGQQTAHVRAVAAMATKRIRNARHREPDVFGQSLRKTCWNLPQPILVVCKGD